MLLWNPEHPVPADAAIDFVAGEPDEDCLADDVILGDETPIA